MTTSTQQVPIFLGTDIPAHCSVDVTNVTGPSNYWPNTSSYDFTDSLTSSIDDLVNNYLRDNCYGITLGEVLSLIRKHQPERLL